MDRRSHISDDAALAQSLLMSVIEQHTQKMHLERKLTYHPTKAITEDHGQSRFLAWKSFIKSTSFSSPKSGMVV
jgi:hypothetical protein